MSKPRYDWWPYVKGMIRRYPSLKARYDGLHTPSMTVAYSEHIGGGEAGRTTETVALRELPSTNQREYEAVRRAIQTTKRMRTGTARIEIIRLTMWDRTHSLEGAAQKLHYSYDTVKNYHTEFIRLVGVYYGLMDEE